MKDIRDLAIELAKLSKRKGRPEYLIGAERLEMYASGLHAAKLLPDSIYDDLVLALYDKVPEGISAEMKGVVTFQIWYKREPCLQGLISKENEDLVTTDKHWRWDDRENRHGEVMRGNRENRQHLADLVLQRKLGRSLQPGQHACHVNGNRFDFQTGNITLCDPQETLYMQKKGSKSGLTGVVQRGRKWAAYRPTTPEERVQGIKADVRHIGMFNTSVEAGLARDEEVKKLRWPKKTRLNFPESDQ